MITCRSIFSLTHAREIVYSKCINARRRLYIRSAGTMFQQARWCGSSRNENSTLKNGKSEEPPMNPDQLPVRMQERLSPEWKAVWEKYLAGKLDSMHLEREKVRNRLTYGSLMPLETVFYRDMYSVSKEARNGECMTMRLIFPTETPSHAHQSTPILQEPKGIILYFPGGGHVFNSPVSEHGLTTLLAQETQCIVLAIGHRLAPEYVFPAAHDDAEAAFELVKSNTVKATLLEDQNTSQLPLFVAGCSAGAGLAAGLALRKQGIKGVLLMCPILTWDFDKELVGDSWEEYKDSPFLRKAKMEWFKEQVFGVETLQTQQTLQEKYHDYRASPLLQLLRDRSLQNKSLPPFYIVAAECDVLLSQAQFFAQLLNSRTTEGVRLAQMRTVSGAPHALFSAARESIAARNEIYAVINWVRQGLGMEYIEKSAKS